MSEDLAFALGSNTETVDGTKEFPPVRLSKFERLLAEWAVDDFSEELFIPESQFGVVRGF